MQRMQSVFSWLPAWSTPRGMTAAEAREEAQPHHEVIDVDGSSVVEISRDVSDSLEDSLLTPTVRLGPAPAPFCADELREFETRRDWVQRMIAKLQRENDFQSPRDVIDHLLQKGGCWKQFNAWTAAQRERLAGAISGYSKEKGENVLSALQQGFLYSGWAALYAARLAANAAQLYLILQITAERSGTAENMSAGEALNLTDTLLAPNGTLLSSSADVDEVAELRSANLAIAIATASIGLIHAYIGRRDYGKSSVEHMAALAKAAEHMESAQHFVDGDPSYAASYHCFMDSCEKLPELNPIANADRIRTESARRRDGSFLPFNVLSSCLAQVSGIASWPWYVTNGLLSASVVLNTAQLYFDVRQGQCGEMKGARHRERKAASLIALADTYAPTDPMLHILNAGMRAHQQRVVRELRIEKMGARARVSKGAANTITVGSGAGIAITQFIEKRYLAVPIASYNIWTSLVNALYQSATSLKLFRRAAIRQEKKERQRDAQLLLAQHSPQVLWERLGLAVETDDDLSSETRESFPESLEGASDSGISDADQTTASSRVSSDFSSLDLSDERDIPEKSEERCLSITRVRGGYDAHDGFRTITESMALNGNEHLILHLVASHLSAVVWRRDFHAETTQDGVVTWLRATCYADKPTVLTSILQHAANKAPESRITWLKHKLARGFNAEFSVLRNGVDERPLKPSFIVWRALAVCSERGDVDSDNALEVWSILRPALLQHISEEQFFAAVDHVSQRLTRKRKEDSGEALAEKDAQAWRTLDQIAHAAREARLEALSVLASPATTRAEKKFLRALGGGFGISDLRAFQSLVQNYADSPLNHRSRQIGCLQKLGTDPVMQELLRNSAGCHALPAKWKPGFRRLWAKVDREARATLSEPHEAEADMDDRKVVKRSPTWRRPPFDDATVATRLPSLISHRRNPDGASASDSGPDDSSASNSDRTSDPTSHPASGIAPDSDSEAGSDAGGDGGSAVETSSTSVSISASRSRSASDADGDPSSSAEG